MSSIPAYPHLTSQADESQRVQLLGLLADKFLLEEIKTLAFDIGVDFDELEGEAKTPKIRELIRSAERQNKLDALIAAAARERPNAPWPQKQSPSATCPYRGLSPFAEQDAPFFFGRERLVEQLAGAVNQRELIALVGSSGSGKSSVVFAGLLPRLRRQGGWIIVCLRPGRQPFDELARALTPLLESQMSETDRLLERNKLYEALIRKEIALEAVLRRIAERDGGKSRSLLVVDQFEELYSEEIDDQTRRLFVDSLLAILNSERGRGTSQAKLKLVLTLRADFMGRVLDYRPLSDALQDRDLKLGPMNREELGATIRRPAESSGLRFEAGLVERILDDLTPSGLQQMDTSNLPPLEFALEQLWTLRTTEGLMTHRAYEAIGEVGGAISRYADAIYEGRGALAQANMRRLLVQMVLPGGVEDSRRRVTRREIGNVQWPYVEQLVTERLVVTDRDGTGQDTAEVIHEALIQNWGRMQEWMKEERPFRIWQDQMRVTLNQWQKSQKDDDLLSGTPLALSREWLQKKPESLTEVEIDFIQRSAVHNKARKRYNLYLFLIEGSLGAAIAAGVALAIFAFILWKPDDPQFYKLPLPITVLAFGLLGGIIGGVQGVGTTLGLAGCSLLKKPSLVSCALVTMVTSGVTGGIFFFVLSLGGAFWPGLSFTSISALGFFVFAFSSGGAFLAIITTRKRYSLRMQIAFTAINAALGAFIGVWIAYQIFGYITRNSFLEIALGFSFLESVLCGGMAWGLDLAARQGNMPQQIDALRSAYQK